MNVFKHNPSSDASGVSSDSTSESSSCRTTRRTPVVWRPSSRFAEIVSRTPKKDGAACFSTSVSASREYRGCSEVSPFPKWFQKLPHPSASHETSPSVITGREGKTSRGYPLPMRVPIPDGLRSDGDTQGQNASFSRQCHAYNRHRVVRRTRSCFSCQLKCASPADRRHSLSEDERCTAAAGVRSSEDGSLSNTRRRVTPVRMANSRIVLEGRVSSEENTMCNQPALKRLVKRGQRYPELFKAASTENDVTQGCSDAVMSAEETEWDSGSKACSERFSSRDVTSQWSILGALRDRLMAYAKRHCDRGSIVGSFSDIFISKDGQWYVAQKVLPEAVSFWVCPYSGRLSDEDVADFVRLIFDVLICKKEARCFPHDAAAVTGTNHAELGSICCLTVSPETPMPSTLLPSVISGILRHMRGRLIMMREVITLTRRVFETHRQYSSEALKTSCCFCSPDDDLCVAQDQCCFLIKYLTWCMLELKDPVDSLVWAESKKASSELSSCQACLDGQKAVFLEAQRRRVVGNDENQALHVLLYSLVEGFRSSLTKEALPSLARFHILWLFASELYWIGFVSALATLRHQHIEEPNGFVSRTSEAVSKVNSQNILNVSLGLPLLVMKTRRGTSIEESNSDVSSIWYRRMRTLAERLRRHTDVEQCFSIQLLRERKKEAVYDEGVRDSNVFCFLDRCVTEASLPCTNFEFLATESHDVDLWTLRFLSNCLIFSENLRSYSRWIGSYKQRKVKAKCLLHYAQQQRRYSAWITRYAEYLCRSFTFPIVVLWLGTAFLQTTVCQEDVLIEVNRFPDRLLRAVGHVARRFVTVCSSRHPVIRSISSWENLSEAHSIRVACILHYLQVQLTASCGVRLIDQELLMDKVPSAVMAGDCTRQKKLIEDEDEELRSLTSRQLLAELSRDILCLLADFITVVLTPHKPTAQIQKAWKAPVSTVSSPYLQQTHVGQHYLASVLAKSPVWGPRCAAHKSLSLFHRRALLLLFARIVLRFHDTALPSANPVDVEAKFVHKSVSTLKQTARQCAPGTSTGRTTDSNASKFCGSPGNQTCSNYSVCCCFFWLWGFFAPKISLSEAGDQKIELFDGDENSHDFLERSSTISTSTNSVDEHLALDGKTMPTGAVPLDIAVHCLTGLEALLCDDINGNDRSVLFHAQARQRDLVTFCLDGCTKCPLHFLYTELVELVETLFSSHVSNATPPVISFQLPAQYTLKHFYFIILVALSRVQYSLVSFSSPLQYDCPSVSIVNRGFLFEVADRFSFDALRFKMVRHRSAKLPVASSATIEASLCLKLKKVLLSLLLVELETDEMLAQETFAPERIALRSMIMSILGYWILVTGSGGYKRAELLCFSRVMKRVEKLLAFRLQCLFLPLPKLNVVLKPIFDTNAALDMLSSAADSAGKQQHVDECAFPAYKAKPVGGQDVVATPRAAIVRMDSDVVLWSFEMLSLFLKAAAATTLTGGSDLARDILTEGTLAFFPPVTSDLGSSYGVLKPSTQTKHSFCLSKKSSNEKEPYWLQEARQQSQVETADLSPDCSIENKPNVSVSDASHIRDLVFSSGVIHPFYNVQVCDDTSILFSASNARKKVPGTAVTEQCPWTLYHSLLTLMLSSAIASCVLETMPTFISLVLSRLACIATERCCVLYSMMMTALIKNVHSRLTSVDRCRAPCFVVRGIIAALSLAFVALKDPLSDPLSDLQSNVSNDFPSSSLNACTNARRVCAWLQRLSQEERMGEKYIYLRLEALHRFAEEVCHLFAWVSHAIHVESDLNAAASLRQSLSLLASGCASYVSDELCVLRSCRGVLEKQRQSKSKDFHSSEPDYWMEKNQHFSFDAVEQCLLRCRTTIAEFRASCATSVGGILPEASKDKRLEITPDIGVTSDNTSLDFATPLSASLNNTRFLFKSPVAPQQRLATSDSQSMHLKRSPVTVAMHQSTLRRTQKAFVDEQMLIDKAQASKTPLLAKPRRRICPDLISTPATQTKTPFSLCPRTKAAATTSCDSQQTERAVDDAVSVVLSQDGDASDDKDAKTYSRQFFQNEQQSVDDTLNFVSDDDLDWIVFDDNDLDCLQLPPPSLIAQDGSSETLLSQCQLEPHWKAFIDGMFCNGKR